MGMYVKGAEWEVIREITLGNVKFIGKLAPLTAGGFAPKIEFDTGVRQSSGVVGTEVLSGQLLSTGELGKLVVEVENAAKMKTEATEAPTAAPVFDTTPAPVFDIPKTTTAPMPSIFPVGSVVEARDGTFWRVIAEGVGELIPQ